MMRDRLRPDELATDDSWTPEVLEQARTVLLAAVLRECGFDLMQEYRRAFWFVRGGGSLETRMVTYRLMLAHAALRLPDGPFRLFHERAEELLLLAMDNFRAEQLAAAEANERLADSL